MRNHKLRRALGDRSVDLNTAKLAESINSAYKRAQALRDDALIAVRDACRAALDCGDLLNRAREKHKGEFLLWLHCNCPAICERTARNYMRIAKLRQALAG